MTGNDVERVAAAIGTTATSGTTATRRQVSKVAWSLPIIATGIAAPASAASPPVCAACAPGTGRPPACILSGVPGGTCNCGPGLICVGTGPFGIVNVCVGTDLIAQTCNGSTCYGVCLATNSAVLAALNALTGQVLAFTAGVINAAGALIGGLVQTCVTGSAVPTNICASPLGNDGSARLGVPCLWHEMCTAGLLGGTLDAFLKSMLQLVKNVESALGDAGIAVVTPEQCEAKGLVCTPEISLAAKLDTIAFVTPGFVLDLGFGFCGCPTTTCKGKYDTPCTPAVA